MLSGLTELYYLPFNVFMNVIEELLIFTKTEISLPEVERRILHFEGSLIHLTLICKFLNRVILIIHDFDASVFMMNLGILIVSL